MMRSVAFTALLAFAAADVSHVFKGAPTFRAAPHQPHPVHPGFTANIIRAHSDIHPDGSYQYDYETDNGISVEEQGAQKLVGADYGTAAHGSYRYTSPEGLPVAVQYVADDNGFQPQSDVLPTPPPIPEAILRSLEYNAAHPEQEHQHQHQQQLQPHRPPGFPVPFHRRFRRAVMYY